MISQKKSLVAGSYRTAFSNGLLRRSRSPNQLWVAPPHVCISASTTANRMAGMGSRADSSRGINHLDIVTLERGAHENCGLKSV